MVDSVADQIYPHRLVATANFLDGYEAGTDAYALAVLKARSYSVQHHQDVASNEIKVCPSKDDVTLMPSAVNSQFFVKKKTAEDSRTYSPYSLPT